MSNADRYYKSNEIDVIKFYQLPKVLFTNPKYWKVSLGAKVLYAVIRDRQDLSIKNGWVDENNNVYSIYTIVSEDPERPGLAELLRIDRTTVMRYKKELVKCDLLEDRRVGRNQPNRLYVFKPETEWGDEPQNPEVVKCDFQRKTSEVAKCDLRENAWKSHFATLEVAKCDPNELSINDTESLNECMAVFIESGQLSTEQAVHSKLIEQSSWLMLGDQESVLKRPDVLAGIFTMVRNQFPNQLHPDVMEIACQLYAEQVYDWKNFRMKFELDNPIGFFHKCYADAIKQWKART